MMKSISLLLAFSNICFSLLNENCQQTSSSSSSSSLSLESDAKSNNIQRPNILFILVDDLGWNDISFHGGQFPTPHMDALYGTDSVRISRHYIHLICSPSRSQFLTGRYAMEFGFGTFVPWDDTEIGGIPIGQATIANWLSDFGDYTSYAVGKWHVGYANRQLTPLYRGFDHFYGFYQGAIDYTSKTYLDIEYGDSGIYDWFEDGQANYEVVVDSDDEIDPEITTMHLYGNKIVEYFEKEAIKRQQGDTTPFYMYAAMQSMHSPFPEIPSYREKCSPYIEDEDISYYSTVGGGVHGERMKEKRASYCQLLLLTDDIIGKTINSLKELGLYENTLIVFTADNGGSITKGGSNYPLRGSKGEMFDGNQRVLTSVSGGVIEKLGLFGQIRNEIVSNLDWTPTLLEFAGYLKCIDDADKTWEGISQYDMIVNGWEDDVDKKNKRNHLILNIADRDLKSFSMLVEHEGNIYKYIQSSPGNVADRWIYASTKTDTWSVLDEQQNHKTRVGVYYFQDGIDDADDSPYKYSQIYEYGYLFDLTNDISELSNLLNPENPKYSKEFNDELTTKCKTILKEFMETNKYFSEPIQKLHDRLPMGNGFNIDDGKFVRPFLTDLQYRKHLENILINDNDNDYHSEQQIDLYLNSWQCPKPVALNNDDMIAAEKIITSTTTKTIINGNTSTLLIGTIVCIALFLIIGYGAKLLKQKNNERKTLKAKNATTTNSSKYKTFV